MAITKIRVNSKSEAKNIKGSTKGKFLEKMSDRDIVKAIKQDPDALEPSDYELTQFKPFLFLKKKLGL